jgi:triosephosphate isomerase
MSSKLIVGNWKMNGSLSANQELVRQIVAGLPQASCRVAVCVPCVYLAQLQQLAATGPLLFGAQDISAHEQGAFTGEVSAAMLHEFAVRFAINT